MSRWACSSHHQLVFRFSSDSICPTQPKWPQILRRQCYLAKASKISDSSHKYFPLLNTVHVNPECLELLKALEVQKIIWMRSTSLVAVVAKNTTRGRGKVLSPSYWLKCFLPGIMNFKGFLGRCVKKPSVAQKQMYPPVEVYTHLHLPQVGLRPLQLIRSRVPGILPPSQEEGTIHPVGHSQPYQTIHKHTEPYTNQNIPNHTKPYQIVLTKRSQFILNLGQRIEDWGQSHSYWGHPDWPLGLHKFCWSSPPALTSLPQVVPAWDPRAPVLS